MSYKYPVLKNVANWVREGKLPPDLDMEQVLKYWIKHHRDPNKKVFAPWKDKPRFYNRALTANARARKNNAPGKITAEDMEYVWTAARGRCLMCGADKHLVFDHITPYYKGGTNTADNLQLLCRICNMEKGVK